ncbi:hypothetical protein AVEN_520-1 [Araneus ventricosus]|uniref:Uncharacterized protein n=1 Tax=Araneus ventricosus TaxID=182803 RepID=A0A4Y2P3S7_ARAVE|nr:hypothetical protein AVEN_520-1 [Araneus ventricosus]
MAIKSDCGTGSFTHWEYLKLLAENGLFGEFPFPDFNNSLIIKKIFAESDANAVSLMRRFMSSLTSTAHLCSSEATIALAPIRWSASPVACLTVKPLLSSLTLSIAISIPLL